MIADSSTNGLIEVYDSSKNFIKSFTAHSNIIEYLKLLSNGNLASCSDDKTVNVWNTTTWTLLQTYTGHRDTVYMLEEIDIDKMASGSRDKSIHIWQISTGAMLININAGGIVYSLRLLSNGYLAYGTDSTNTNLKICDYTTGSLISTLNGHSNTVFYLESLNSQYLASGSGDYTVKIWNLAGTGSLKYTLTGHTNSVIGVKLLSLTIIASGSNDYNIKVWNWINGTLVYTLTGHTNQIWESLDLFDSQTLISGSKDLSIKFWSLKNGTLLETLNTNLQISSLVMLSSSKY